LSEEVAFDRTKVINVDWLSYPVLDITEAPEVVDKDAGVPSFLIE